MRCPNIDTTLIMNQVINPIRYCFGDRLRGKFMVINEIWLLIPSLARVFEVANSFLFVAVDTNHWLSGVEAALFDSSNVAELLVALRMLGVRN